MAKNISKYVNHHYLIRLNVMGIALMFLTQSSIAQMFPVPFSVPKHLNSNADEDSEPDELPWIATDGNGVWIAVWQSKENVDGGIGTDYDILFTRSLDDGKTWSSPAALNSNAGTTHRDGSPRIFTDQLGLWIVTWESNDPLGGTIDNELDVFVSRSSDNGANWTTVDVLNGNAVADADADKDFSPHLATDGSGLWVAVWRSLDDLTGTIANDADILVARSTDGGNSWTFPVALNSNATSDIGQDVEPRVIYLSANTWLAVWRSNEDLDDLIDNDYDILLSRSSSSYGESGRYDVTRLVPRPLPLRAQTVWD